MLTFHLSIVDMTAQKLADFCQTGLPIASRPSGRGKSDSVWHFVPLNLACITLAVIFAVLFSLPASADNLTNAKDMFYQELKGGGASSAAANKDGTSVAYCLELHRGNAAPVLCNNRYAFKSGDGLRLHVKSSSTVYAYILLLQGSSGKKALLYPPPGEDNRLEAGKECLVPKNGMIVFDNNPGVEKLGVVFSPQPLDNSRALGARSVTIDSSVLTGIPQKAGSYSVYSSDGVYELGSRAPGNGLVYVHNPDPRSPTGIAIDLNHANAPSEPPPSPTPGNHSSQDQTPAPSSGGGRAITDKWAFIVGINTFEKFPSSSLRFCVSDASALRDFLVNEAGFKANHVYFLSDEQATTANILRVMGDLLPRAIRRDDLVLLYFSTHGTDNMHGENYIVTHDFDGTSHTGVPMQQLGDLIKSKIPSDRVITILDTCFSGNARDLDAKETLNSLLMGSGQIIVSACSANEKSLEDEKLKHGYFTYYLIDSFRREKSLKASFDLAQKQVSSHTMSEHQHPQHPIINYNRWKGNDVVLFAKPTSPRS